MSRAAASSASAPSAPDEKGFTLIELMIVTLIMGVVLSIAAGALYSLTMTGNRDNAMVAEEQATSVALTQLTRDVRSASAITFPTGASPSDQLEVADFNPQTDATTTILWVYDPAAETLSRQEENAGLWSNAGFQVAHLTNSTGEPVFAYYDNTGTEIPGGTTLPIPSSYATTVAANATAVAVDIYVSSTTSGVGTYHQSDEIALTNLLNDNSPSGEGT